MTSREERNDRDPSLEQMAELLDRVAAAEESIANEAAGLTDAPGLDRVGAYLEENWADTPRQPRGRWRTALVPAAAGLVAVVTLWALWPSNAPSEDAGSGPGTVYLDDEPLRILVPGEDVPGWESVEWTAPEETAFEVTIRDAGNGEILFEAPRTMETKVDLDPTLTATWPREIYIELKMREADGSWRSTSRTSRRQP